MHIPSVVWQLAPSSGKAEREGKTIVKFTLLRIVFIFLVLSLVFLLLFTFRSMYFVFSQKHLLLINVVVVV